MIFDSHLQELGEELRAVRQKKKLSLNSTAQSAKISPAYLQKIEGGVVKNPSPRVLYRVSEVLDLPYGRLMELAGYMMPGVNETTSSASKLQILLRQARLSDEEEQAVAAFVTYLKAQRRK